MWDPNNIVIETVSDFVADNPTDSSVIKVGWSILTKEDTLKDTSRNS